MRSKSQEVIRTSLTICHTSPCDSSRCNTYSLYKGLLIKYRRQVKCRWCLTSAPWTTSASSPSTSHLHNQHGSQYTIQYLQGINTAPRHKSYTKPVYTSSPCIYEAMQHNLSTIEIILINKNYIFENFIFSKFCQIFFDFCLFLINLIKKIENNFVMYSVHEQCS